jgi:hypothetical protein
MQLTKPEQLYCVFPTPKIPNKKSPAATTTGAGSLGRKPDHGPIPKAESSPNPEPDDPEARTRTILLMQLPETPIKTV